MKTITFDETTWKLVPLEPDLEMGWVYLDAARQAQPNKSFTFSHAGYRAMIAATPVQPASEQTGTVGDELLTMLKQIRDFRHFTPEFKKKMDEVIAKAEGQQLPEPDLVQVIGIKNGVETLLGQAPMPPKMKARDLVRETFGHFDDADGSDAELCFGVCEQLIDHMAKSGLLRGS